MIPFLHGALASNGAASAYELIESQTVGAGGSASITFTVPAGYQHVQLRAIARTADAATEANLAVQFNNDTSNNYYAYHYLSGNGSSASSGASGTLVASAIVGNATGANAAANIFEPSIVDILDYTSTAKNKVLRILAGGDLNGSGRVGLTSSMWISTAAITSMKIFASGSSANLAQYSTFSLYGIKGT